MKHIVGLRKLRMVAIAAAALSLVLLPSIMSVSVRADREWGPLDPWVSYTVTPSGIHFVNDPLVVAGTLPTPAPGPPTPTSTPTVVGSVIYVCSDERVPPRVPRGLQYDIAAETLSPNTAYDVRAYPLPGSQDYPAVTFYELGTLYTNAKGEGHIGGFVNLNAGPFNYQITVELGGKIVLTSLPAYTYYDPFLDTLPLPFPLGTTLWNTGDPIDGYIAG